MTEPLTPELLAYGTANASDPQISPDGGWILYTLQTVDAETKEPRSEIRVCNVDGSDDRELVRPGRGARWSPDGRSFAFTARQGEGVAIFVAPIDAPEDRRLVTAHAQGIDELTWSPDGRSLAYTTDYDPDDPDESGPPQGAPRVRVTRRLDYKSDGRGYVGDRRPHVFVVGVRSGERRRVTTELVDHVSPQWSPDSGRLAVRVGRGELGASQLCVVDLASNEVRPVTPEDGRVESWAWSPAGDRLLVAADPGHTLHPDLFLLELTSGTTRQLTDDLPSVPDQDLAHPVWLDDRRALWHSFAAGASGLELVDTETGEAELVERWQARHSGLSADRARRFLVQGRGSLDSVGEIAVYDREIGQTRTIAAHNDDLFAKHPPAAWERFEFASDGFTVEAWLLFPSDFDPGKCYPVILDVHGGPTANYGYGFMAHQQCFATNGFLVVYPNQRGSNSYGREFTRANIRDWGGGDYRDVLAAVDEVARRSYADADRVGIFGISYGGYLTSWAIGQSDRFAAAVCGEPIFDLESDYGTSDVAFSGLERFGGGPPHGEPEWYVAHSPSTFAHRTRTPTLIFHGEADQRCPIGQSEQMFVALKKAGCEVEYVRYPGSSHMFFAFGPPAHRADFLARTLAWFKEHLGEPA